MTSDKDANKAAVSCINEASVCSFSTLVEEETAAAFNSGGERNVELSCTGDPARILLCAIDSG